MSTFVKKTQKTLLHLQHARNNVVVKNNCLSQKTEKGKKNELDGKYEMNEKRKHAFG